jgi:orotate phosphoribosyltransferase
MKTSKFSTQVAKLLLKIKAVQLNPTNPFTWSSGLRSPIYCDNRLILSPLKERRIIVNMLGDVMDEVDTYPQIICGVATGAIGWGILLSEEEDIPFGYSRTEKKAHGNRNQLEGIFKSGESVLVVEDLISTGGSTMNAIQALQDAQMKVIGVISLFSYGFTKAHQLFTEAGIEVISLCDFPTLLEVAKEEKYITDAEYILLACWNVDPQIWSDTYVDNQISIT